MAKFLVIVVALLALCGLVYQGIVSIWGDPRQLAFSQDIANTLATVADHQAQAIESLAEANLEQAKLNMMIERQQLERARAETWLVYVGIVAITIFSLGVMILVTMIVLQYRRSNPRKVAQ